MKTIPLNFDQRFKIVNTIELEPAPPANSNDIHELESMLTNFNLSVPQRYTALVKLKKIASLNSAKAIFRGCAKITTINVNDSDLLIHDCIYTLGQFQIKESIDLLIFLLRTGKHPVTRHEAAFALGNMWANDILDNRVLEILNVLHESFESDSELIVQESCSVAISNLLFYRSNIENDKHSIK